MLLRDENGQVEVSPAGVDIHLLGADDARAEPQLVGEVEGHHDGHGGVLEEEGPGVAGGGCGVVVAVSVGHGNRPRRGPELRRQDEDVEREADPGGDNARLRAEGELAERSGPARPRRGGSGCVPGRWSPRSGWTRDPRWRVASSGSRVPAADQRVGQEAQRPGYADGHQGRPRRSM